MHMHLLGPTGSGMTTAMLNLALPDVVAGPGARAFGPKLNAAQRAAAIGPVLNKLRDFLVRPRLRRVLCQVRSTLRLEDVIDSGKILLADLSVGRWGESASELIGSFLLSRLWQAALGRSARPEDQRRDF